MLHVDAHTPVTTNVKFDLWRLRSIILGCVPLRRVLHDAVSPLLGAGPANHKVERSAPNARTASPKCNWIIPVGSLVMVAESAGLATSDCTALWADFPAVVCGWFTRH